MISDDLRSEKYISTDYAEAQKQLHTNDKYGMASLSYGRIISDLVESQNCKSLTDYGAGKCRLLGALRKSIRNTVQYFPYDPAFPEYGEAKSADLVVCLDVLEHIEPDKLDGVLQHLASLVLKVGLFSIHTKAAKKILPDGRNAHLIQQPFSWWAGKLLPYFEIVQVTPVPKGFWIMVSAKEPRDELRPHIALVPEVGRRRLLKRLIESI